MKRVLKRIENPHFKKQGKVNWCDGCVINHGWLYWSP